MLHVACDARLIKIRPHQRLVISLSSGYSALPNRNPGSFSEHSSRNVHGSKLLEEQLRSVWNVNLRDSGLVLARSALEALCREFSNDILV